MSALKTGKGEALDPALCAPLVHGWHVDRPAGSSGAAN